MEIFKIFSHASEYLFLLPYIIVDNKGKKEMKSSGVYSINIGHQHDLHMPNVNQSSLHVYLVSKLSLCSLKRYLSQYLNRTGFIQ